MFFFYEPIYSYKVLDFLRSLALIDPLSIQRTFLLFEASFCLFVSLFTALLVINDKKNYKNQIVMGGNFFAAILLFSDFLTYVYDGVPGKTAFVMIRVANFVLFLTTFLIVITITMYVAVQLFGTAGLKAKIPGQKRFRTVYWIAVFCIIVLGVSQFTDLLYYFDENNAYHRNPFFFVTMGLVGICLLLNISVLIENRKRVDLVTFLSMLAYILIPGIATIIQSIFYGYSFVNISIGFVLIIMFIENSYSQSQEVLRISKLEVRTGLLNEHGCIGELMELREKGKICNYCAVYFDISKFSYFNRKYGMIAGDMILKNYSAKLREMLKPDEFLAREGSDHFIAVIKKENLEKLLDFLKETEVSITYGIGEGKSVVVKVSSVAGVFEINEEYMKAEDILSNAYTALLYAKTVSKKSVDYMSDELKEKLENERKLKGTLFEALEKGEFQVYYQPKIDINKNTLCGGEALVRWLHDDNVIPPEEFIPVMEKNDSVCALDFYVLRHVCEDIKEWQKEGLEIPTISVNLSRRNLSNENLAKDIDNIVKAYGISKDLIEIEITETNDEFPTRVLREFVSALHELGYKVAVDDFGCGAASLSLLRETDFDTLKIDKGFIHSAFDKNLTILTHIVNLAKAIDMKIVAEGVETQKQKEILSDLGVNIVQGYFYDRPLPKDEMVSRMTNRMYN